MFYDMLIGVSACTYPKSISFSLTFFFFFFLTYLVYGFFLSFLLYVCPTLVRSQVFSGLVLRLRGSEVILQEGLKVLKSVPFIGLPPPALQHQFMKRGRAAWSAGHPVAPLHLLQHFTVVHA